MMYIQELFVKARPQEDANTFTVHNELGLTQSFNTYHNARDFYQSLHFPGILYQESPSREIIHCKVYLEV